MWKDFRSASVNILKHYNKIHYMSPYAILGLKPDATDDEVKKAYRKLALQYHPDKNRDPDAPEKFRNITKAYKQIIDGPDDEIFKEFPEIFEMAKMFGNMMGKDISSMDDVVMEFMNMTSSNAGNDPLSSLVQNIIRPKGPTVNTNLSLTLEQIYEGGEFDVYYSVKVPTGKMKEVRTFSNLGPLGNFSEVMMIPEERMEQRATKVKVPSGCYEPIIVPDIIPSGRARNGDLIINISTIPHKVFKRSSENPFDLKMKLDITLKEALLGFEKVITQLDGTELDLKCQSIVNPYEVKEIKGAGMPKTEEENGSLFIKFQIEFPKELTEEQKEVLDKL